MRKVRREVPVFFTPHKAEIGMGDLVAIQIFKKGIRHHDIDLWFERYRIGTEKFSVWKRGALHSLTHLFDAVFLRGKLGFVIDFF